MANMLIENSRTLRFNRPKGPIRRMRNGCARLIQEFMRGLTITAMLEMDPASLAALNFDLSRYLRSEGLSGPTERPSDPWD